MMDEFFLEGRKDKTKEKEEIKEKKKKNLITKIYTFFAKEGEALEFTVIPCKK